MTAPVSIKMPDGSWQANREPAPAPQAMPAGSATPGNLFDVAKLKSTKFPYAMDMAGVTSLNSAFNGCSALVEAPPLDTSLVTAMASMFNGCSALTKVPTYDTARVTNMANMFLACLNIQALPPFNTSAATTISAMFGGCNKVTTLPAYDFSKVSTISATTFALSGLTSFLATGLSITFTVANCKMDAAALETMFRNLGPGTGKTVTVTGNPGAATCDKSIATAKGWTVAT